MKILQVLIEHSVFSLNTPFSYLCNDDINVDVGYRVKVDFNNQKLIGYVLSVKKNDEALSITFNLKYIDEVIDTKPIISDELLDLAYHMEKEYITPFIGCLKTILPPLSKPQTSKNTNSSFKKIIKVVAKNDLLNHKLTSKQVEMYNSIKQNDGRYLKDIKNKIIVQKLKNLDLVDYLYEEIKLEYLDAFTKKSNVSIILNEEQKSVCNDFINSKDFVYLLQGITGSGKTEVYISLVDYYIKQNKTAIVLVPEISLTPMIISRFNQRFSKIAVLHGNLSSKEKQYQYEKINSGQANVIIGARSAIFAPAKNIGIIILDEEQSTSYKQDKMPSYHAKDIAIYRAKKHGSKILLGSATPSFESKARALKGIYHPLYLTKRASNAHLPTCNIVNMREDYLKEGLGFISKTLDTAINVTLNSHKKIILLHNRRGYSPYVSCRKCGYIFKCPICEITMTYHKFGDKFKCHYCNHEAKFVHVCPKCGGVDFLFSGIGTQKVEEIFQKQYPLAKILRMDTDTTNVKYGHQKILEKFENEDYNILLGTQMVAKGLDFKDVTLVGVIDADITLAVADFRSNEYTFELISQVAGRAGRGNLAGNVIIQTFNPEHYAITFAAKHDYDNFYKYDMAFRKRRNYPPFSFLSAITLSSKKPENALLIADSITAFLKKHPDLEVIGPAIPYIYKEKDFYKVRIILKSKKHDLIITILNQVQTNFADKLKEKYVIIAYDIDTFQII